MTVIPIDERDIEAARELRAEFAQLGGCASEELRDPYDEFVRGTPVVRGVQARKVLDDPAPGWWCEPGGALAEHVILFLHGGLYSLGRAGAYVGLVSQIAARTQMRVFALEYPLAPEVMLPVALRLALKTLQHLVLRFGSVALVGDCAGGGLALATALEARRRKVPVAAVVAFSPWTDLSLSGDSARNFAVADPILAPASLRKSAKRYLGSAEATDPRASPLFDPDLKILPPTFIQVGSDEILLDDSRRFGEAAKKAGSFATIEVWQGMHHVFVLNTAQLESARRALDHAASFLTVTSKLEARSKSPGP